MHELVPRLQPLSELERHDLVDETWSTAWSQVVDSEWQNVLQRDTLLRGELRPVRGTASDADAELDLDIAKLVEAALQVFARSVVECLTGDRTVQALRGCGALISVARLLPDVRATLRRLCAHSRYRRVLGVLSIHAAIVHSEFVRNEREIAVPALSPEPLGRILSERLGPALRALGSRTSEGQYHRRAPLGSSPMAFVGSLRRCIVPREPIVVAAGLEGLCLTFLEFDDLRGFFSSRDLRLSSCATLFRMN